MADRYIDQDETKIYGEYAAGKIRKRVVGLVPEFDKALEYVASEIETATNAVEAAVTEARTHDATIRKGTKQRVSALKQAIDVLGRFSKHLDTHPAGTIDRKTYFTVNGTAGAVGRSASRVLLALNHIALKLKAKETPVKSASDWAKECAAAASRLAPLAEHSDDARTDRREATPEIESARAAWLQVYGAAKLTVEAALRLTGRLSLLPKVFFDLTVPGNTKVTAAPEETEEIEDDAAPDGETEDTP